MFFLGTLTLPDPGFDLVQDTEKIPDPFDHKIGTGLIVLRLDPFTGFYLGLFLVDGRDYRIVLVIHGSASFVCMWAQWFVPKSPRQNQGDRYETSMCINSS